MLDDEVLELLLLEESEELDDSLFEEPLGLLDFEESRLSVR